MRLLFLFILIPFLGSAQLIDNRGCNAFTDDPFFYNDFIRSNKVKSITGHISTKNDLQVIKKSDLVTRYEFDTTGKLTNQFGSFNLMGKKDTTFVSYIYDTANHILTKRTNDSYGFFSYNYVYDTAGNVLSRTYCRDENKGSDRYHFKLARQYTIVKESYTYSSSDSVIEKQVFNNHGRVYQKEKYFYNQHDLLSKVVKKLIMNHKRSEVTYAYNDMGLVAEKRTQKDMSKEDFNKIAYSYDEFGNLEFIDEYKNGKKHTHKEVLYDKSTYLMKALLVQDVATNHITILKFSYEFFE